MLPPRQPAPGTAAPKPQVDVSRAKLTQAGPTVAVDPSNDHVLLAGSAGADGMRAYTSADGGARWTSQVAPPLPDGSTLRCATGGPTLAIDLSHHQYYAFLVGPCTPGAPGRVALALGRRDGPTKNWQTANMAASSGAGNDGQPTLAVDNSRISPRSGRIYLAWSAVDRGRPDVVVLLAHSDNAGATWSPPLRVTRGARTVDARPNVTVGRDGTVYLAWETVTQEIEIAASSDGGAHFGPPARVDSAPGQTGSCRPAGTILPADPKRCIAPGPATVTAASGAGRFAGRVYVTYSAGGARPAEQDVFVSAFDPQLRLLLSHVQINPPDGPVASDQFLPVAAVDQETGDLWACFYDTTGDRTRTHTRYSCSLSSDGGATWSKPVRAASVPTDLAQQEASSLGYGDASGLAVAGDVAHPFWTDGRNLTTLREEIYTTALDKSLLL